MKIIKLNIPYILIVGPVRTLWPHALEISMIRGFKYNKCFVSNIDIEFDEKHRVDWRRKLLDTKAQLVIFVGRTHCDVETISKLKQQKILIFNEQVRLPEYTEFIKKYGPIFDHIYHFQETAVSDIYPKLIGDNTSVSFLPIAADEMKYPMIDNLLQDIDILMLGNTQGLHHNRKRIVNFLKKETSYNIHSFRTYNNMQCAKLFARAKIVLNLGLDSGIDTLFNIFNAYGLQQRIFEAATSTKGVIFTHRTQQQLFTDMQHIAYFQDEPQLLEKVKILLNDEKLRNSISSNMFDKIMTEHLYKNRCAQIIRERLPNDS